MHAQNVSNDAGSRNITHLLKKYETKQPGEINLKDQDPKLIWRFKQKLRDADIAMQRLNLQGTMKDEVKDLIREFDFNNLCKRCSYEQKIVALCLYVKFTYTKRRPLSDYAIVKEVGLTDEMFLTIVLKLSKRFREDRPTRHRCHV